MDRLLIMVTVMSVVGLLLVGGGAALASPLDSGVWVAGPVAPWGHFRFDGHYYAPTNRVYFLCGRSGSAATITPDVNYFDVATSTFGTSAADMPTGVANYQIVQLTDATGPGLFVFGGTTATGTYSTTVQVYRPDTDTAAVVAGDTWPGTVAAGCPSIPGAVVAYNNKAYLLGGFNGSCATPGVTKEVWIYDPMAPAGSRFTAGPPLTLARSYIQATVVDNYLYALGGDEYPGTLVVSPRTERLDLTNPSATWDDAAVAEMPTLTATGVAGCDEVSAYGFDTLSGTELQGKIVIAGCGQWSSENANSFIYDVATNTWADWEPLTTARRNYASATVSSPTGVSMWIFGGRSGSDAGVTSNEFRTVALAPTISSIKSKTSKPGSTATIYGTGFSTDKKKDVVYFGTKKVKSISKAKATSLRLQIPRVKKGTVGVYVVVDGKTSNTVLFQVK